MRRSFVTFQIAAGLIIGGCRLVSAQEHAADAAAAVPQERFSSTNADPTWRPTAAQRDAVQSVMLRYLAARDAGMPEAAYAFLSVQQKQYVPYQRFDEALAQFNKQAGPLVARRLRAVTWYKDTPKAGPGLYVAVDYSSDYEHLALQCGYVTWQEQADGSFQQVFEETNVIDKQTMAKLSPAVVEAARAQFRC